MQVKPRSYPHPVLAHFSNDIVGSVFQPVVTVKISKNTYVFEAVFKTNNADLLTLIAQKKARYAVHLECPQTRYRNIFTSSDEKFPFEIEASMLDGRAEIASFILAAHQLDTYGNALFHPDFAKLTFRVQKADTLAVGQDREFTAEKKRDPLRNVPSIFSIVPADADDATGMDVDASGPKVRVILSKSNFEAYASLKSDQKLHPMLSAAVIVPALVTVIDEIKRVAAESNTDSLADRRWFIVVARRLRDMGIDPEKADTFLESSLRIAHELVGQPLGGSLEGLKTILQDDVE